MIHCEHNGITPAQRNYLRAARPFRVVLCQQQLAAYKIAFRLVEEEYDL